MNKYIIFGIILFILLTLILQVIDIYYMESIILTKKYTPKLIDFVHKNINKTLELLKLAFDLDNTSATLSLGDYYIDKNISKTIYYYNKKVTFYFTHLKE